MFWLGRRWRFRGGYRGKGMFGVGVVGVKFVVDLGEGGKGGLVDVFFWAWL